MIKAVLSEKFIVHHEISKQLKKSLDEKLMIKEITRAWKNNERVNDEDFYHDYFYTRLQFMKYYKWIAEYAQDHYNVDDKNKKIFFADYSAIVLKPNQGLTFHNHVDEWDYHNNSFDVSMLYPLVVPESKKETNVLFSYDNGRFRKQRFKVPLRKNFLLMFSSHLDHSILPNQSSKNMILLSIKFKHE
jgi:hypothetical protein|tara:strand:- start:3210 stop:3773 length:564 start_codon:yes stop_codon:yes gene_type:complete